MLLRGARFNSGLSGCFAVLRPLAAVQAASRVRYAGRNELDVIVELEDVVCPLRHFALGPRGGERHGRVTG